MQLHIRHISRFRYDAPVSESVMEARLHPRTEPGQRCLAFTLAVEPEAARFEYRDYLHNIIHAFDIPGGHRALTLTAHAAVETYPLAPLPPALGPDAWRALDAEVAEGDFWEALAPDGFARPTPALDALAREWDIRRRDDPLSLLREINTRIYDAFEYVPESTRVDSPIDHALENRQGVCQDFTHIMIALARRAGIPCRYVSGYLYHRGDDHDRAAEGAMHAWCEAYLPSIGWAGFDPTNDTFASERHIRVAIGRDYADVPPTRGVFKGLADHELCVAVQVYHANAAPPPPSLVCVYSSTAPDGERQTILGPDPRQQQQQQ
jgi:transglutaminase-like putative cysteine protease